MATGDTNGKAKAILRLETEEGTPGVRSLEEEMLAVGGVLGAHVNSFTHRIHVWYDPAFLKVEDLQHKLEELTKGRQRKVESFAGPSPRNGEPLPPAIA